MNQVNTVQQKQGGAMNPNYKEMTAHSFRAKKKVRATTVHNVPKIGQQIDLDLTLVSQDKDAETGKPCTPMSKLRFFDAEQLWKQVPRHEAGMLVFFNNEPQEGHTQFVIKSIIPSQLACYAEAI